MIAVPFFYFGILLFFILSKKRTFEISAYVVSLYLICSFFSILVDFYHLRSFDTQTYKISAIPTVLYCFLLTITIWPFFQFKSEKIVFIKLRNKRWFDRVVYFYFICFILVVISSANSIFKILHGNFLELRAAAYQGETFSEMPSGILKPLFIMGNIFGSFSLIMLLFYFFSIVYLKRSKLFNIIILLSSTSMIFIGIAGIDRSKVVYWIISYGFMAVFFWKKMSKVNRKKILLISLITLVLPIAYFVSLTISRFSVADSGTQGGIISYAGQSFINFCFFFDQVHFQDFSLQRIFPLFYKLFVHNGIADSVQLNHVIGLKTGKHIGVFSTFIGDIMVSSGKVAVILYCFFFYIITSISISFQKRRNIYFFQILLVFCFLTVPMLGIFLDFYASFKVTLPFLLFILLALSLNIRIRST